MRLEEYEQYKQIPTPQLLELAKALANDLRLRILESLSSRPMSVTELAKLLGVAQPTVSISIQMLQSVGLVQTTQPPGRGKMCSRTCDSLLLDLPSVLEENVEIKELSMPVGMYTHFHVKPSCGLVGKDGVIGNIDDVQSFYAAERAEAQLVWFSGDGFVEYSFPNPGIDRTMLKSLTVSAELCSEALGYNEAWSSDITLYVNGVEIGTWTCPGDFGEIKGQLTPGWWHGVTQHGLLVEWTTDETGSRFQEAAVSEKTVWELNIDPERPIKVRFAVKPDAKHRGGMNLFGKQFGNHPQEIKLSFLRGKPTPL